MLLDEPTAGHLHRSPLLLDRARQRLATLEQVADAVEEDAPTLAWLAAWLRSGDGWGTSQRRIALAAVGVFLSLHALRHPAHMHPGDLDCLVTGLGQEVGDTFDDSEVTELVTYALYRRGIAD